MEDERGLRPRQPREGAASSLTNRMPQKNARQRNLALLLAWPLVSPTFNGSVNSVLDEAGLDYVAVAVFTCYDQFIPLRQWGFESGLQRCAFRL